MTAGARLCLNMIVKNEMANLERCLASVVSHIDCWVIGDTGSTDGTQEFITSFFAARNLPGELHRFPFENFEQARNQALDHASASPLHYDYLLLTDADMELVVENSGFRTMLTAPGYRLIQRTSSGLAYGNSRLVKRGADARYRGVTHEYLDVPGGTTDLKGVWYKDHASGSNRVDKFERDIRLLLGALETEPNNGRSVFYLAQSYRDAGRTEEAAKAYAKRAGMGGWDEEAWRARLEEARCLRKLADEEGFLRQALAAFNQRPHRAEPLYDLAKYYRERGMHEASILFSELGLAIPLPAQDILFIESFIYTAGLLEEYSICANYSRDPARKERGFAACNWLALNRGVPSRTRDLARWNLKFYAKPAQAMMPSFTARPVGFALPEGYRAANPSVARQGQRLALLQPCVPSERPDGDSDAVPNDGLAPARNFLLHLDDALNIQSAREILPPPDLPASSAQPLQDPLLFAWREAFWCCGRVRALRPEGGDEQIPGGQVLARIDEHAAGACRLADWRVLRPEGAQPTERGRMPRIVGGKLQFIHLDGPMRLLDDEVRTLAQITPPIAADEFRGGSPAIAFDGGWLALIHEVLGAAADPQRVHHHRFILLDQAGILRGASRPFFFDKKGMEYAAGLAWHPDEKRLVVSYRGADGEARIATIEAGDVRAVLDDLEQLLSANPGTAHRTVPPGPVSAPAAAADTGRHGGNAADSEARQPIPAPLPGTPQVTAPQRRSVESAERNIEVAEQSAETRLATPEAETPHGTGIASDAARTPEEKFRLLAPFLSLADSPIERREQSRAFDARIADFISEGDTTALPQIHCFYQVMSDTAKHRSLVAATQSMRAVGHPVRVWSYSPQKLDFLRPHGVELRDAADVVPKSLFERIVGRSEIRYFSDIFRYAALYEHGGLWMDTDVVMLRPFPFRGDHFFNLQWHNVWGHFVCGNVIYAEPYSRHMRALYGLALDRFFAARDTKFGDIGPKLLSDYIASDEGKKLQARLFSPMFFNAIDWTEIDRFNRPAAELADYLNDERVTGIHLWNAFTHAAARDGDQSLIAVLSDPPAGLPSFTSLADRFDTDKNRRTGNRHCYARVYDRLLGQRRFALRRLMEIGLCRGLAERDQRDTPSVALWQAYFPFCRVVGVDVTDFSRLNNERFTSFVCDQSKRDELRTVAAKLECGSFDVIVDDGSHASADQQQTMAEFWPLLADGGWYFIENLDWQPPGEDRAGIALTKTLLREIQEHGAARSIDPFGVSALRPQFGQILFFDSHYELDRAGLMGGLVAIRKRGGGGR